MPENTILILVLVLNLAHFFGDFTSLNRWFIVAKRYGKPVYMVAGHGAVNGALYGMAVWLIVDLQTAMIAFSVETLTHTLIDVLKGRINRRFPVVEDSTKAIHWTVMGVDQLLHQMVLIFIVFLYL
ncbi:MAG: DUF3307 domain-containing protein [Prevotellaceae bacterium]|jgi:hypothetical protein|nr:DUF3307 domain-containing protein [Prevotellaceae bacterium]